MRACTLYITRSAEKTSLFRQTWKKKKMIVRKDSSNKEKSFTIATSLQIELRLGLYITDKHI